MGTVEVLTHERLRAQLDGFERRYRLSSEAFYARFSAGQTPHDASLIYWAWLYEAAVQAGIVTASPTVRV